MKAALERDIARGRTTPGPDQANDTAILMIKPTPPPSPAKGKGSAKAK